MYHPTGVARAIVTRRRCCDGSSPAGTAGVGHRGEPSRLRAAGAPQLVLTAPYEAGHSPPLTPAQTGADHHDSGPRLRCPAARLPCCPEPRTIVTPLAAPCRCRQEISGVGHRRPRGDGIATPFEITDRVAPIRFARITGGLYLAFIGSSVMADVLGHIGRGNTLQVYDATTTRPGAFRLALVCAFVSTFLSLMATWGLYVMLRTVNNDLALLFLLLNAVGVAVQCASMLGLVSALFLGNPGDGPATFSPLQAAALAQSNIDMYRTGLVIAQLFFGTWLFPLGYLVLRSGRLPRLLGTLLILDGVAELVWFLQALLLPSHPEIKTPGTFVSLLAEVGLALWLLIRGVKDAGPAPTGAPGPTAARVAHRDVSP